MVFTSSNIFLSIYSAVFNSDLKFGLNWFSKYEKLDKLISFTKIIIKLTVLHIKYVYWLELGLFYFISLSFINLKLNQLLKLNL